MASAFGFAVAAGLAGAVAWASGCHGDAPPGASVDKPARASQLPAPPPTTPPAPRSSARVAAATPADAQDAGVDAAADASVAEAEKPYTGPLLGALAVQTPVYPSMESSKKRLGYIRLGGKVPVDPNPTKNASCQAGWYRLLDGGYVCGKYATTDLNNPQVRMGITAPNLEEVLPYRYAYNTAHGTPLYRSVPSKEDMIRYEPYLEMAKKAKRKKKAAEEAAKAAEEEAAAAKDQTASASATPSASASAAADAPTTPASQEGAPSAPSAPSAMPSAEVAAMLDAGPPVEEPAKPWWQQIEPGKPVNVTLKELESEADGTVAKRMVKGFFVAVDKTFSWNSRSWYKTTAGLVAPSDRMYIVKPPTSQGIDVPEGAKQVGFILATKSSKFEIDEEQKTVKVKGPAPRFTAVGLTGVTATVKSVVYRQTTEGWWMKGVDATYTEPGPPPADLAPGEKWIDVNLTRKTLLAMEGDKPVYAALVSPGRRSKNKKKDHSTVKGTFRIREKHVAVTMDGDGTVAGDLPYSIEDVPYVAYFEGSYALHGAFWHSNFGREMSHGCVNLSPLDAKKIFFWSEPRLPRGWHAVWSTPENRGTLIVVHD
ncbi:L,D-transpeptidase family protein [Polyangium spumosum]|uniref:L,D-transpeptidase family protein n=2 Tax=Polyangium spumosum TaxID=889282 RepID=A0A6N7PID2_9BACT|nr:L,D-transpeptidase [Polyangium spumosum]MRG90576.1 L,D-transpeptidase family protein [Polyangium spumosum]